jgi:Transposase DDE domain
MGRATSIASSACSDATIRRRLKQWAAAGIAEQVHAVALAAYHRIIGLLLADIGADGCVTKAPCGGDKPGPSPVDRRKGGLKRSVATDGGGVPLGIVSAGANRHDSPLLGPTLRAAAIQVGADWPAQVTVHLDAGYDSTTPASCSMGCACTARSPARASPPRVQVGKRWVVERTH